MAQKLPVNGPTLFKASEEKLQEIYGLIGSNIGPFHSLTISDRYI